MSVLRCESMAPPLTDQKASTTVNPSPDPFYPTPSFDETETELRSRALVRLNAKRHLRTHIVVYIAVNLMLVIIWWVTGAGDFWPVFPILGWGIGLAYNVWDVMSPKPTPDAVAAEMDRLRHPHA